jgi:hypothetical protein
LKQAEDTKDALRALLTVRAEPVEASLILYPFSFVL